MPIPPSATASHQRVRLKLNGLVSHATIIPGGYSPETGVFMALFDTDPTGATTSTFTPASPQTTPPTYTDQNGLVWELIN
jgi:hypothetical protein